jgi:hypothetical protein
MDGTTTGGEKVRWKAKEDREGNEEDQRKFLRRNGREEWCRLW